MATGADRAVGLSLVAFSLVLFTYYSVWVVVLPFVDGEHVLRRFFLPQEFTVLVPAVAAVVVLLCVGAFTAVLMWKNYKPKKVD